MSDNIAAILMDFFGGYPQETFKKGQTLIWAGEDPPGIMFLESGNISQYDIGDNGQKVIMNIYKPHSFFPMSWAINQTPNQYFFEALSAAECRVAPRQEVLELLRKRPELALDLISRLYRGMDGLLMRITELMVGSARSQLLLEILISTYRFGQVNQDGTAKLQIKTTELAQRTGMARETVSRELKKLAADGVIVKQKGALIIREIEKLSR